MTSPTHILFIQTAFVGDLLLSIPSLRVIRAQFPSSKLTLLCRTGLGDFMRNSGVADEVIEADKSSPESWKKIESQLSSRDWFQVYCPHQSPRSLMLVRKLSALKKIGYRSFFGKFVFDQAVDRPMYLPEALRQMVLIESKRTQHVYSYESLSNQNLYRRMPKLLDRKNQVRVENMKTVPDFASMTLESLSGQKENAIVLAPGSVWATKKWTKEGFAEVAVHFAKMGKKIWIVGSPDEREIADSVKVAAEQAHGLKEQVQNLAGELSLWESAKLMAKAQLVVTNDSGAMHMAACAGTPSVSVFGPTVLEQGYRPWQSVASVVHAELSCRPCGKHGSQVCPIGTHECMKLVGSESVIMAAQKLI